MSISISFEESSNLFIIKCPYDRNSVVLGLPDRKFYKRIGAWKAPALRRNIDYMRQHMGDESMYTPEALDALHNLGKPVSNVVSFPSWYSFKSPPWGKYQSNCLNDAFGNDYHGILFEQGLGKTWTSINLVTAWRMDDQIDAVVVVCPSSVKMVWEDEIFKHCPIKATSETLVAGKYKKADRFIAEKADFPWFIIGIEALSQGSGYEYLKRFLCSRRCVMIVDESTTIKTPNKLRTDKCIMAGALAKKRLILTGTSITKGLEDWYTQLQFLDPNIIGFSSYYGFRNRYCRILKIQVSKDRFVDKIVGYQNEAELMELVKPYLTRVEKKDVLDLPPKVFQPRYITMTPMQKKIYKEAKQELVVDVEDSEYEIDSVLEQQLRLMQITSGFYPHDDGKTVVPTRIPGKNPKLEELKQIMDQLDEKVIIYCQYQCEVELVCEYLKKAEIGYVEFHGKRDDLEKKFAVHSFMDDPSTQAFVCTSAAARGLTLTACSFFVYWSTGNNLDNFLQSQDRIHRIGQDSESCDYIILMAEGTIDRKVYGRLKDKQEIADIVHGSIKEDV